MVAVARSGSGPAWLSALDGRAAAHFGGHYLAAHPGERDCSALSRRIERRIAARRRAAPGPLPEVLASLVQEEFRVGDVVSVDDWLLSRSEAQIYALSVLAAQPTC